MPVGEQTGKTLIRLLPEKKNAQVCLFVLFLYIPKSTAMVMVGRSVCLTTLFS